MKHLYILLIVLFCFNCNSSKEEKTVSVEIASIPKLDLTEANRLSKLPLECINTQYPNRLGQTLGSDDDLASPQALHPAFYGCFDWHSAVHGHWSLVTLLKQFPELENSDEIRTKLLDNISEQNILAEVAYFQGEHNKMYERTYGWAWLLKLAETIDRWDDPFAKKLEYNLLPLTELIVAKYLEFLPKLNYPIRVGTHSNTAFGLSFAWDFAITTKNSELQVLIEKRAKDFYLTDADCPMTWEPSGYDFLSPCLEEAALMKRVLNQDAFKLWINKFLPQLKNKYFELKVGKVSDREDGLLVHLDGVNFSRAWNLNTIAQGLTEYNHLKNLANKHINYSLPTIIDGNYEGGHWLGSFAIYALNTIEN